MFIALLILAIANALALALGVYAISEYRRDDGLSTLLDQHHR